MIPTKPAFAGLFYPDEFLIPFHSRQTGSPKWTRFFYFHKLPMLVVMTAHKRQSYIIGIDEVGRGPLAGPVVVCAVAIPRSLRPSSILKHVPLRDSKKLTALQRVAWTTSIISDPRILHSIASASPAIVDRINITQAANRSATRALSSLLSSLPPFERPTTLHVYLDGGLHINAIAIFDPHLILRVETIIKGDETIPAISLASIVAKQHRDALMRRAHKKYPLYGFDRHAGYGTKKHIGAIRENGHSPLHRKSFLKKFS